MVAASAAAVGSQAFIDLEEGAVRPEDLFFHKYFNLDTVRTKRDETRKRKDAKKVRAALLARIMIGYLSFFSGADALMLVSYTAMELSLGSFLVFCSAFSLSSII